MWDTGSAGLDLAVPQRQFLPGRRGAEGDESCDSGAEPDVDVSRSEAVFHGGLCLAEPTGLSGDPTRDHLICTRSSGLTDWARPVELVGPPDPGAPTPELVFLLHLDVPH